MSLGGAPLRLLWRQKLAGRLRLLGRKATTLGGLISILVGLMLLLGWIASILARNSFVERTSAPPSIDLVRLALGAYLIFVAFSSLSFRGVYLPKAELERLFASPVSRSSILRYRMASSILTALPFTILMALFLAPRFASTAAAASTIAVVVPCGTVFGQGLSLLAARSGGLFERVLGRVSPMVFRIIGTAGIVGLFAALAFGPGLRTNTYEDVHEPRMQHRGTFDTREGPRLIRGRSGAEAGFAKAREDSAGIRRRLDGAAATPIARMVTAPLEPWARAAAAPSFRSAAPWLAGLLAILVLMFEGVARLPIDFRDASLHTSAEMELRLDRMRSGQGGAGVFGTSARARGLHVPWFAGRSPFGAIVWQRATWLVRQARGTLFVAAIVGVIGVLMGTRVFDDPVVGPATIGVLGVVYLASGVRADFRADLDRMETLKAWPLPAWKTFVGTLLPGVLLTTLVVIAILVTRGAILGQLDTTLLWTSLVVPFIAYVWVAVDNAVFLLFPVRFVPGQGSALQHTGRGFLLVMLRGILLLLALTIAGGGAFGIFSLLGGFETVDTTVALAASVAWATFTAFGLVAVVTWFGAWALRRFDVSRVPASTG